MKSATTELLKYFEREGIQCLGEPYIGFNETVPAREPECSCSPCGRLTLLRIATGRWFIQWWRLGPDTETSEHVNGILALLEGVVARNRPIDVGACDIANAP